MNHKKKLGQFFTDPTIAHFMASLVIDKDTMTILDPAVGPGILLKTAHNIKPTMNFFAYELDCAMVNQYKQNNNNFDTQLTNSDYLTNGDTCKYDAIICNPPYNKFQQIDNRYRILENFRDDYGIKMSGYSNYCVYFLIKSLNELSKNGKCCYIIPYEFLNAGYGQAIKEYILAQRKLKTIIKFNNDLRLFSDAITTSCVLLFENRPHDTIEFVNINSMAEIVNYRGAFDINNTIVRHYSDLDSHQKWLNYFSREKPNQYSGNIISFLEIAQVKRGIATGNNTFFSLSQSKIRDLKLSDDVCLPCIAKSPDIKSAIFDQGEFEKLRSANRKVFLFDGSKAKTDEDFDYIKYGESMQYHKSYLTSHRTPWYSIENKDIAPIWLSVFSRNRLKVVRNKCMIRNLTTFHGVYCKKEYEKYVDVLFCYLLTPTAQSLLRKNKREYGEGLDKFEPNDINNAKILDLKCLKEKEISDITEIYNTLSPVNFDESIEQLDKIFAGHILQTT